MGVVLRLVDHKSRETVAVLRCLLELAIAGDVAGIAVCYQTPDRDNHTALAGVYKEHPAGAVNAASMMKARLLRQQAEHDDSSFGT